MLCKCRRKEDIKMNKELEALERIKNDLEYITRLDYVEPVVRGEVRDQLYKIYHRELPELDLIETALKDYEKQTSIINTIKETIEFTYQEPMMEVKENGEISVLSRVGMSIRKHITEKEKQLFREWILKECFPEELKRLKTLEKEKQSFDRKIEKKLKAIEIIKETWNISFFDEEQMITIDNCYSITFHNKKEYDLLKEILL